VPAPVQEEIPVYEVPFRDERGSSCSTSSTAATS
jgi:hypothetical protein